MSDTTPLAQDRAGVAEGHEVTDAMVEAATKAYHDAWEAKLREKPERPGYFLDIMRATIAGALSVTHSAAPTTEQVERAARAIVEMDTVGWAKIGEHAQRHYTRLAHAALTAAARAPEGRVGELNNNQET